MSTYLFPCQLWTLFVWSFCGVIFLIIWVLLLSIGEYTLRSCISIFFWFPAKSDKYWTVPLNDVFLLCASIMPNVHIGVHTNTLVLCIRYTRTHWRTFQYTCFVHTIYTYTSAFIPIHLFYAYDIHVHIGVHSNTLVVCIRYTKTREINRFSKYKII